MPVVAQFEARSEGFTFTTEVIRTAVVRDVSPPETDPPRVKLANA